MLYGTHTEDPALILASNYVPPSLEVASWSFEHSSVSMKLRSIVELRLGVAVVDEARLSRSVDLIEWMFGS